MPTAGPRGRAGRRPLSGPLSRAWVQDAQACELCTRPRPRPPPLSRSPACRVGGQEPPAVVPLFPAPRACGRHYGCCYNFYEAAPSSLSARPPVKRAALARGASWGAERREAGQSPPAAARGCWRPPPLSFPAPPSPARPFHCGASAGRARGGAEMVAPGAAPAPPLPPCAPAGWRGPSSRARRPRARRARGAPRPAPRPPRSRTGSALCCRPTAGAPWAATWARGRGGGAGRGPRAHGRRREGLCITTACILHRLCWAAPAALPGALGSGGNGQGLPSEPRTQAP